MRLSFRRVAGILFIGLLIEAAFVAGLVLAPTLLPVSPLRLNGGGRAPVLDEAWDLAEDSFYGTVPSDTVRAYAAVRGMISAYNDPYTVFVEPPQTQLQSQQLAGKFGGIGASLRRVADGRVILSPFPNQPADKAGVKEGDVLITIAGRSIGPEVAFETISTLLRGEVGTRVTIEVLRGSELLSLTIDRAEINVPSVTWRILSEAPSIGYIAISIFAQPTKDELIKAIDDVTRQGAVQLILDLRDNGGGLLDAAVDVAGQFVPGVVVIETRRNGDGREFVGSATGVARDMPLAVLVNGNTASAAEIVAGAIQDRQRGQLIGDQTFGKGSVQNILPLSDKSSLHVTVAQWLTPNRRQITGTGLTPDMVMGRSPEDVTAGRDPQLAKAIEELTR